METVFRGELWWHTVFLEGVLVTFVMMRCNGNRFGLVTVENRVGVMTCPFFHTRLHATYLNLTHFLYASLHLPAIPENKKPSQHPWTHERATGFAYNPFLCIFCVLCIFVYTFTHLGIHLHRLYTYWCIHLQPDTDFAYKSFYIHILWFYVYLNIHLHILHIIT